MTIRPKQVVLSPSPYEILHPPRTREFARAQARGSGAMQNRAWSYNCPTVSIIIPTLNEEHGIRSCLASVVHEPIREVIVADGGSHDRTRSIASDLGATVMEAPRGRAKQMNAAASIATGDVLLFLHADCTLARGAVTRLRRLLSRSRHQTGYFRQRIAGSHPLFRLIELGSNVRARWLQRPYGDQAMFFRRPAFEQLGGFPDVVIMEDLYLARAARSLGPFLAVPEAVTCSARRWRQHGIIRRILRNWSVALAECRGEPLEDLLCRYEGFAPPSSTHPGGATCDTFARSRHDVLRSDGMIPTTGSSGRRFPTTIPCPTARVKPAG